MIDVVAPAVIVLGVLRGTVFGRIRDLDTLLGTAYGLTFLVALAVAVATFLWRRFVIVPATRALAAASVNPDGPQAPSLRRLSGARSWLPCLSSLDSWWCSRA